ncbi:GGDEF domain-containing protein [Sphingomonas sp. IW22]|uniref:GGDEF domain-containing protein n=1 Tax=Sphingomonas sp. IW22 TaxID=3242489 RepID=UPI003521977E
MAVQPVHRTEPALPAPMLTRAASLAKAGAWRCELAGNRLGWTSGVYRMFGVDASMRIDRPTAVSLYEPQSRETMERLRAYAIATGKPFTFDAELVRIDGERRWIRVWGEVEQHHGRAVALNGWKQDITDERRAIDALRALAENDPLTGLANRAAFQARLESGLAVALVLFDLDGFKQINDRYGHAAGDQCLRVLGERLQAALPDAVITARLGGDEFATLLPPGQTRLAMARRMDSLARSLAAPVDWDGRLLQFGVSGGIAFTEDPGRIEPKQWLAAADAALYEAKRMGRGRVRIAPSF